MGEANVTTLATTTLSAVMLLRSWNRLLYVKSATGTPDVHMQNLSGGAVRWYGTNTDGSTLDYTIQADGSGTGTQSMPDGSSWDLTWAAPVDSGGIHTEQISERHSDGARLDYTVKTEFSQHTESTWDGTATTPDGRSMQWHLDRVDLEQDELGLQLPDGTHLTMRVPLTSIFGAPFWPRYAEGATGTVQEPGEPDITYTLAGANNAWTGWDLAGADGTHEAFSLGPNMAGEGRVEKESELLAALSWDANIDGDLGIVASGAEEVHPSAAAQAFQMDQWVHNTAALGPAPMY